MTIWTRFTSKQVDLKQILALGLFYAIAVIIVFDIGTRLMV